MIARKLPPLVFVQVRFRVNYTGRDGVAMSELRPTLPAAQRYAEVIVKQAWPAEAQIIKQVRYGLVGEWKIDRKFVSIKVV